MFFSVDIISGHKSATIVDFDAAALITGTLLGLLRLINIISVHTSQSHGLAHHNLIEVLLSVLARARALSLLLGFLRVQAVHLFSFFVYVSLRTG